jgi:putative ABC transport system substrate-binding protein
MIPRRTFVHAGALALAGVSLGAPAQRASAVPRIGYLTPGANPRENAFWQGMRELGYVEGKTIVVERRSAEGDLTRLPGLAADIVRARPDVFVAITTAAAIAAKQATTSIPIVMVAANDPVGTGLVASFARPGGNVSGTSSQTAASIGKLFDMLRQVLPGAKRVAALWDPINAISQQLRLGETLIAAARLQLLVRVVEVQNRDDLARAFASVETARPDAMLVPSDTFFLASAARVAELGREHRIPVFSTSRVMTEAGILASYGADLAAVSRRAATYVQRILKGARPGELPVELPTRYELVINASTAKAVGVVIPPAVMSHADEVLG